MGKTLYFGGEEKELAAMVELPIPDGMTRVETGPLMFGDDWPGMFLRGDDALGYALYLDQAANRLEKADELGWMDAMFLRQFAELLRESRVNRPATESPL
jgi:hypothetical protein